MKTLVSVIVLASLLSTAVFAATPSEAPFDDAEITNARDPAWFKAPFLDLRVDLAEAAAAGKQGLMILFGTRGCAYCRAFIERSLNDAGIASALRARFDVLHLEIFDDAELKDPTGRAMPVKEFARREGAAFSPTLVFYGTDGSRLHKVVGYQSPERFRVILEYVGGGHHRTLSFRDFLKQRARLAPAGGARASAVGYAPPGRQTHNLDRRRPAAKPLLVLFERKDCEPCRALHVGVLRDPEVRTLLARFQVVRLDADDAGSLIRIPDGGRITPARWAEQLELAHLPAMLFHDERGREVLRIDALTYRQRMLRSLRYVLDRAYLRGISYQAYAREKSVERLGTGP
jgi:thioredoxin-related protein